MPHDHPERANKHESDSLFKGLVMGAVVGIGLAWLLGSEEGKKLKKQIAHEGNSLFKKAEGEEDWDEDLNPEPLPRSKPRVARPSRVVTSKPTKTTQPRRFFRKRQ